MAETTMTRPVDPNALRVLATPFFENGGQHAFVAFCCDRVFVGIAPATSCKKCKGIPTNVEVLSLEAAVQLAPL